MNKKLIASLMLAIGFAAFAASAKVVGGGNVNAKPTIVETPSSGGGGDSAIIAMLAFNAGTVNVGAEYESMKSDSTGFSGYFLFSGKDEKSTKAAQTISFGASLKAHVYPGQWDLSAAPGFGVTMADVGVVGNTSQKTLFGPTFRMAALYRMSAKTSLGIEQFVINNWFEKEAQYTATYHNVLLRIDF